MARFSSDLLAQARVLARREPRHPKQSSLRRSVSTSYYALFHFLIEEVTKLTVGTARSRTELCQFAARAFSHGKMKTVCEEFARATPNSGLLKPFWPTLNVRTNQEIRTVAQNFVGLQQLRHEADYNLIRTFTRQETQAAADQVKDAMDAWRILKTRNEPLARLFALSLLLWPGLGGR